MQSYFHILQRFMYNRLIYLLQLHEYAKYMENVLNTNPII